MGAKADKTKAVILAAARERFAETGYEAATIRIIAADANIDPSMVMRYFGNKEQLFAAAAEFDLRFPDLTDVDPADVGNAMASHFLARWEDDEALVVLLRSATTNTEAAQRMTDIFATSAAARNRQGGARRRSPPGRSDRHTGPRHGVVPVRTAASARGRHEPRRAGRMAWTHPPALRDVAIGFGGAVEEDGTGTVANDDAQRHASR